MCTLDASSPVISNQQKLLRLYYPGIDHMVAEGVSGTQYTFYRAQSTPVLDSDVNGLLELFRVVRPCCGSPNHEIENVPLLELVE